MAHIHEPSHFCGSNCPEWQGPQAEVVDPAGKRNDTGKPRLSLVPRMPLYLAAEAYEVGADKYAPFGWRDNPMSWSQVRSALDRHLDKYWELGETHDQVDGQHHLGAVIFAIFTLAEYERLGIGEDDRPFVDRTGIPQSELCTDCGCDPAGESGLCPKCHKKCFCTEPEHIDLPAPNKCDDCDCGQECRLLNLQQQLRWNPSESRAEHLKDQIEEMPRCKENHDA